MSITVNEANYSKGYKVINLNFKPVEGNTLQVSGDNSTWVNGRAAEIEDYVSRYSNKVSMLFTKHGPNFNSLIFLIVLILLPSINTVLARSVLMIITIFLLLMMNQMYKNYFPKAVIYLGKEEQSFIAKNKDAILVGVFVSISGVFITFLAKLFATNWEQVVSLIQSFIAK